MANRSPFCHLPLLVRVETLLLQVETLLVRVETLLLQVETLLVRVETLLVRAETLPKHFYWSSGHPNSTSVGHPVIRSTFLIPQSVIRSSGQHFSHLSRSSGHPKYWPVNILGALMSNPGPGQNACRLNNRLQK